MCLVIGGWPVTNELRYTVCKYNTGNWHEYIEVTVPRNYKFQ